MTEQEKVVKAFEFCLMPASREELENDICSHEDCPYYREYNGSKCISAAASDALALLKAQEPDETRLVRHYSRPNVYADLWLHCEKCGGRVDDRYKPKFCPECGRAVKWE